MRPARAAPGPAQRSGEVSRGVSLCGVQTVESKKAIHLTSTSLYVSAQILVSTLIVLRLASRQVTTDERRQRVTLGLRCRDRPTRDYREPQPVSRRSTYNNPRPHETVNSSERQKSYSTHRPLRTSRRDSSSDGTGNPIRISRKMLKLSSPCERSENDAPGAVREPGQAIVLDISLVSSAVRPGW